MIFSTALWASFVAIITGIVALWKNPARAVNRALFVAALQVGLWMFSLCWVVNAGRVSVGWFRIAALLTVFLPAQAWWVKLVLNGSEAGLRERLKQCWGWYIYALVMAGWIWSQGASSAHYVWLLLALGGAVVLFSGLAVSELSRMRGMPRMNFQIFLMGVVSSAMLSLALVGAGFWLKEPVLFELMPLFSVALLTGTAWALCTTRVLSARHILTSVLERLTLVAGVVIFVWSVQQLALQFVHAGTAYVLSVSIGLWFAAEVHPWLKGLFRQDSRLRQLRRAALEVTAKELRPEAMEDAFIKMLKDRTQAEQVVIMMSSQSRLVGCGLDFPAGAPAIKALQALIWVTPERLERQKSIAGREVLQAFLKEHELALVVANAGPTISFVIGLGLPTHKKPFTHPEIIRLMDVAGTMENALSRARYLKQAQHAEQLATVGMLGASIAHEIRNPLVSIKTFVQLLPNHYQEAVFRDKFFRLIGDEVGRIDRLTEQLLDLSAPRVYAVKAVNAHDLLQSCINLVAAKAEDKGIQLIADFKAEVDSVYTDPDAVKQVVLNLSFNAIQALEQQKGERWIRFETTKTIDGLQLAVVDSGPGIAREVWARLFQPFQSTKSSGFGLGLAICKDILSSIQANISADPPIPGAGATFRITLPCQPPTS
jgi:signal transduction histidine kinase